MRVTFEKRGEKGIVEIKLTWGVSHGSTEIGPLVFPRQIQIINLYREYRARINGIIYIILHYSPLFEQFELPTNKWLLLRKPAASLQIGRALKIHRARMYHAFITNFQCTVLKQTLFQSGESSTKRRELSLACYACVKHPPA